MCWLTAGRRCGWCFWPTITTGGDMCPIHERRPLTGLVLLLLPGFGLCVGPIAASHPLAVTI